MDAELRTKFEFLCQINELQAAMALHETLKGMGVEFQPTDREHLRFVFAVLRYKAREFTTDVASLIQECEEFHSMYDAVTTDCSAFGTKKLEHRLHITIQFIMVPLFAHAQLEDPSAAGRLVLPIDYRSLLAPYIEPQVEHKVREHATLFRRAISELSEATATPLAEKLDVLLRRYPLVVFQRNTIRFLNLVEDHVLGADAIDGTLTNTDGRTCMVPVSLLIEEGKRYENDWMALDESMVDLPGVGLYIEPTEAPAPPVKDEPAEFKQAGVATYKV
ncbi:hypothetical protein ACHHYP_12607 [Achlya hypogyna]|uniref:Uncharacterized protein n=1 Tax=Achlya hypogyna TaxID=1202772 RepID=A0A1V9ZH15_ACHHY|nr:hypothetical protein ACHHYP_12607 [Achlya hypogyna]